MKRNNKTTPTEDEMQSWFYLHSDVAAFTSYVIADDPFGKNRDFNEACFNEAYNTLENALTIIASSEVKSILKIVSTEIRIAEIKNSIIRNENKLEGRSGCKTFRFELSRIGITDNFVDYKWLEHYSYKDYIKIKEPKKIDLEKWLDSKKAPFLSNWLLQLVIDDFRNQLTKQMASRKTTTQNELRTDLKALFIQADKLDKWNEIINYLQRTNKMDRRTNIWQKGKSELAGTIRVIQKRYLSVTDLSVKEVIAISKTNFNTTIYYEDVRGQTFKEWNWIKFTN